MSDQTNNGERALNNVLHELQHLLPVASLLETVSRFYTTAKQKLGDRVIFFCDNPYLAFIALGFAINIAEWVTLAVLILKIDGHIKTPTSYALDAWAATFPLTLLVSLIAILLIVYAVKWESRLQQDKTKSTRQGLLPRISFFLIEGASSALVIIYFYRGAIKQYETYEWGRTTEFKTDLQPPAVAIFGNYNDAVSASLTSGWSTCSFPQWTKDNVNSCSELFPSTLSWIDTKTYGNVSYYNDNPTNETTYNSLSDRLNLQVLVTWDSHDIKRWYKTENPQGAMLYIALYDNRFSIDDLKTAFDCGIMGWTEVPAIGSNTFTITAARIHDVYNKTNLNHDVKCQDFISQTYSRDDLPFTTYRFHLSSSGSADSSVCDTGPTGVARNKCIAQTLIRYETFLVSTNSTKHSIDKKDIALNLSAIVGGVAFVAAFLTMFEF